MMTFVTDFNPHSREGSDTGDWPDLQRWLISIHTPAKGVTANGQLLLEMIYDFNPHSREGSDQWLSRIIAALYLFQSTLPRRE